MAALNATQATLLDWAKLRDPDGSLAKIVEILNQNNQILADMQWVEGNLPTGHRTTIRTGLPTPTWRLLNNGVQPSKGTTAQIDEQCGELVAWNVVDESIAELGGNPAGVRASMARAHLEAMAQEVASTIFYGAATSPEEFVGLAARYNDSTAGNGDNLILGGGTGSTDNTSIWLIAHDEETFSGIFPQGSQAGLKHEDFGKETVENAAGTTGALMRAYREYFKWQCGIALKDWRYAVRIANLDVSQLEADSGAADLLRLLADAEERIPNDLGTRAFYMNRTVRRNLRHQTTAAVSTGGGITFDNVGGKRVMLFGTTPVHICDALLNTEDVVA